MKETSNEEWIKKGTKLFGGDKRKWKFKCPSCGNVQTMQDFIDLDVEHPEKYVHFSCIGRFMPESKGTIYNKLSPCNYTNGGLFNLAKVLVIDPDGTKHSVFEFAKE